MHIVIDMRLSFNVHNYFITTHKWSFSLQAQTMLTSQNSETLRVYVRHFDVLGFAETAKQQRLFPATQAQFLSVLSVSAATFIQINIVQISGMRLH